MPPNRRKSGRTGRKRFGEAYAEHRIQQKPAAAAGCGLSKRAVGFVVSLRFGACGGVVRYPRQALVMAEYGKARSALSVLGYDKSARACGAYFPEAAARHRYHTVHGGSVYGKYPLIPTLWMIFEDSTFAFRSGEKHRSRRIYGK